MAGAGMSYVGATRLAPRLFECHHEFVGRGERRELDGLIWWSCTKCGFDDYWQEGTFTQKPPDRSVGQARRAKEARRDRWRDIRVPRGRVLGWKLLRWWYLSVRWADLGRPMVPRQPMSAETFAACAAAAIVVVMVVTSTWAAVAL